jgi:hypothetical protein
VKRAKIYAEQRKRRPKGAKMNLALLKSAESDATIQININFTDEKRTGAKCSISGAGAGAWTFLVDLEISGCFSLARPFRGRTTLGSAFKEPAGGAMPSSESESSDGNNLVLSLAALLDIYLRWAKPLLKRNFGDYFLIFTSWLSFSR